MRAFKELLRRAGLPETMRLYDLRHTCATVLLSRNVRSKYVQELLGHASMVVEGGWTATRRCSSGTSRWREQR